jgi:DNA-binding protein HU-beta
MHAAYPGRVATKPNNRNGFRRCAAIDDVTVSPGSAQRMRPDDNASPHGPVCEPRAHRDEFVAVPVCRQRRRDGEMLAIATPTYSNSERTVIRFRESQDTHMTKAELIDAVAQSANVTKHDAERTISAFFELVVASAKKGEKVAWPGFGSFTASTRKARTGRNPRTGEPVEVPASMAIKFSASSTLKAELNPTRK